MKTFTTIWSNRLLSCAICSAFWGLYVWAYSGVVKGAIVAMSIALALLIIYHLQPRTDEHPANRQVKGADFDWGMHYFRGIAIVCVVLAHLTLNVGHPNIQKAFLYGATVLFLFISGYLCQFIDNKRHSPALEYYRKKVLNVLLPYIVCSVFTVLLIRVCGTPRLNCFNPFTASHMDLAKMLLLGRAQTPYWYIPFVAIIFAFSPMLLKLSDRSLIATTVCAGLLAVLFPERGYPFTFTWPTFFYLYSYFSVSYLLGMVYCRFKTQIDVFLKPLAPFFAIMVLAIGYWITHPGFCKLLLVEASLATNIQKILMVSVLLVALSYVRTRKIAILDSLAKYSFSLFFMHRLFFDDLINLRKAVLNMGGGGIILQMRHTAG